MVRGPDMIRRRPEKPPRLQGHRHRAEPSGRLNATGKLYRSNDRNPLKPRGGPLREHYGRSVFSQVTRPLSRDGSIGRFLTRFFQMWFMNGLATYQTSPKATTLGSESTILKERGSHGTRRYDGPEKGPYAHKKRAHSF